MRHKWIPWFANRNVWVKVLIELLRLGYLNWTAGQNKTFTKEGSSNIESCNFSINYSDPRRYLLPSHGFLWRKQLCLFFVLNLQISPRKLLHIFISSINKYKHSCCISYYSSDWKAMLCFWQKKVVNVWLVYRQATTTRSDGNYVWRVAWFTTWVNRKPPLTPRLFV